MKLKNITMTIAQIINLEHQREDRVYGIDEFTIFQPLASLETWGMDIEVEKKIIERNYVFDRCNDLRSRDLRVIFYEDKPFAIYQYIGKGDVRNEVIFDKEVYEKLLKDYISEYLIKINTTGVGIHSDYTIENYNMAYFIIDENKIIADTDYK